MFWPKACPVSPVSRQLTFVSITDRDGDVVYSTDNVSPPGAVSPIGGEI